MLADEDTTARMADEEAFVAEEPDGLLDRHPGNAEELRELVPGGQALAWLELAGQDRSPDRVGDLDEGRPVFLGIDREHIDDHTGLG
ncbi:MAG TPA: hypothetical protein VFD01_18505 [Candidatus Dormibacteraeota bacterium]|nr:hypothetical protein [Candidatus Dormibacteraeota bacterium]